VGTISGFAGKERKNVTLPWREGGGERDKSGESVVGCT
jgi:hypothetical protein